MRCRLFGCVLVSGVLLFGGSSVAFGFEGGSSSQGDVKSWQQKRFGGLSEVLLRPGGISVGEGGCGYFALTSVLLKESGDKSLTPARVVEDVKRAGFWDTSWGHFDWTKVSRLYPSLRLVDRSLEGTVYQGGYISRLTGSYGEKVETLKRLVREGYYVVPSMQNGSGGYHYVFLDYVDESTGDIRITDSGFKGSWFSEKYWENGLDVDYVVVLEGADRSVPKFSVYDDKSARVFNAGVQRVLDERERKRQRVEVTNVFKSDLFRSRETVDPSRISKLAFERAFSGKAVLKIG